MLWTILIIFFILIYHVIVFYTWFIVMRHKIYWVQVRSGNAEYEPPWSMRIMGVRVSSISDRKIRFPKLDFDPSGHNVHTGMYYDPRIGGALVFTARQLL